MNIEELAFKDRRALVNLNELDLLNIIEFLQIDRKQWINQFSKTHNESVEIQKENQKLKEHLEAYETYFNRFFKINNKTYDGKIVVELLDKKETQQKEFIKYLENQSRLYKEDMDKINSIKNPYKWIEWKDITHEYEVILKKYKEIIGVLDGNN
jgi:hypothetical protein